MISAKVSRGLSFFFRRVFIFGSDGSAGSDAVIWTIKISLPNSILETVQLQESRDWKRRYQP